LSLQRSVFLACTPEKKKERVKENEEISKDKSIKENKQKSDQKSNAPSFLTNIVTSNETVTLCREWNVRCSHQ
jgi:hypothetical protein